MSPRDYTNTGKRSTEFKVNPETARRYVVVAPARLWRSVQAKAKGVISVRALILGLLSRWVNGDIQHPPEPVDCVCRIPDGRTVGAVEVCRTCGGIVRK